MKAGRRRRAKVQAPDHLLRSETWNGLRSGDPVDIEGPAVRAATWRFQAYVRNTRNGTESVEVVGGRPGEHHVRSFRPDQVFPAQSARRRRRPPSLAEAPQLPFA